MKLNRLTLSIALGGLVLLPGVTPANPTPPKSNSPSALAAADRKTARFYAKQKRTHRTASRGSKKGGLLSRSTVLTDGRNWTMVPKGAVLKVPARLQDRVNTQPTGGFLPWTDFFRRNRGWLQIQHVQLAEARGERALSAKTIEAYAMTGRVTIAAVAGVPISVAAKSLETKS